MFSVSFLHLNHTRIRIQFQCNALNCRKTFFSFSIFTYLSKTHTTVLGASLNLPNTFFTNSSSFPSSANSTCATSFSNIFFLDFKISKVILFCANGHLSFFHQVHLVICVVIFKDCWVKKNSIFIFN